MLSASENVKNLYHLPESSGKRELDYVPYLYVESKIHLNDVRTRFRQTYNINQIVRIPPARSEPLWDDDAVEGVHPENLVTEIPERASLRSLPQFVDTEFISWIETRFIQYLLRTFSVKAYRNFNLEIYSSSGESRNDFIIRCIDQIKAPMHQEFDHLHEVFKRKLERLQQKYLDKDNPEELEKAKYNSRNRELFNRISERVSALFLRTEFGIQRVTRPVGAPYHLDELQERLHALHFEAQEAVTRILDSYEEQAKSIDEYILHPTMKDIHFVSGCVVWIAVGAV